MAREPLPAGIIAKLPPLTVFEPSGDVPPNQAHGGRGDRDHSALGVAVSTGPTGCSHTGAAPPTFDPQDPRPIPKTLDNEATHEHPTVRVAGFIV